MYKIAEMVRASFMIAKSYKINLIFSIIALFFTTIPFYFVARALQPTMGKVIQEQGGDYFGFIILGLISVSLLTTALTGVYNSVSGSVTSGWLEAQLGTSTSIPVLVVGMAAYDFIWTLVRVSILLVYGRILGVDVHWSGLLLGVPVLFLLCIAYFGLGLVLASMFLAFRTIGPAQSVIVTASTLLGGVYYPTNIIPGWIHSFSIVIPMTYGLRAVRKLVLDGAPFVTVVQDVMTMGAIAAICLAIGALSFRTAFNYSRQRGTLSLY
jgi:ABC-2 type transport system permease protein